MQIHGPANIHGPQPINPPHRAHSSGSATRPTGVDHTDQVDISPEADQISRAREASDVRSDRVAEIRRAIADGSYETDEKLNAALDRLLDEMG